jgi:nucleoside-diphosphate-sugar epimerase
LRLCSADWRSVQKSRVLITGSAGLVGRALGAALQRHEVGVRELDLRATDQATGDVRSREHVARAMADCSGVVHLAAVSRVVWAEQDPHACWATNVGGLENVLACAAERQDPPWILFASSREVYGEPERACP